MWRVCVTGAANVHFTFTPLCFCVALLKIIMQSSYNVEWEDKIVDNLCTHISARLLWICKINNNVPCSHLTPGMITSYIILKTAPVTQLGTCDSPIHNLSAPPPLRFRLMTPLTKSRQKILPL